MASTRTYHDTKSAYILPNDPTEHERLDLQTRALNEMMHNRPIHAHLDEPKKVLDIGCGTGAMVLYLADAYPNATSITGIDLSPVPVPESDRPSNITFLQGDFADAAQDGRLQPQSFDYVFSRMLSYGISDWPAHIARAMTLLKPGAWLELQEASLVYYDERNTPLSTQWRWLQRQRAAFTSLGLDIHAGGKLTGYMRDAGLQDVQVAEYRWIFGRWEGHPETDFIGEFSTRYLPDVNATGYRKIMDGRLEQTELEEDVSEMRKGMDWSEDGKHVPVFVVWGRKRE